MSDLAIVIPAYKGVYLDQALRSIAGQTCKNFTLYIGNDASPDSLDSIIDDYRSDLSIKYNIFSENLGKIDLVAHWERCIKLVEQEEWIWLFSDDDIMDVTCVQTFYSELQSNPQFDLYRFDLQKIDENDNITGPLHSYPEITTSEEFLKGRLNGTLNSTVVEYVFRKSHFYKNRGFKNFDLAWGTDDAAWITLGKKNGIHTIKGATVFWRSSSFNISPNYQDREIVKRKLRAELDFIFWVLEEVRAERLSFDMNEIKKSVCIWFLNNIKARTASLPFKVIIEFVNSLFTATDWNMSFKKVALIDIFIIKNSRYVKRRAAKFLCLLFFFKIAKRPHQ